ncbi:MAG: flagella biosynthesis regulator FlaF [Rhodobacteraceae bacterium HLUCCA08]|nr:MAG: flagella biosynthesis regulator FlaF [Rhodobacteraceae bacterium HLUCCA08]
MQAQQAYAPTKSATRTGRETETELLQRSIAQLSRAAADLPNSFPQLVAALHQNRRVWTHLAASVADRDNALPADLRARLFYLSEFVEHHSRAVLSRKAEVGPLIDINTAVMRGLSQQGGR